MSSSYALPTGPSRRSSTALPGDALAKQVLALLGALTALALSTAKELRERGVAIALRVLDVRVKPEHIAQALLHEPDHYRGVRTPMGPLQADDTGDILEVARNPE